MGFLIPHWDQIMARTKVLISDTCPLGLHDKLTVAQLSKYDDAERQVRQAFGASGKMT